MKTFDRDNEKNKPLYIDAAYKVVNANHSVDTGLYEEKHFKKWQHKND